MTPDAQDLERADAAFEEAVLAQDYADEEVDNLRAELADARAAYEHELAAGASEDTANAGILVEELERRLKAAERRYLDEQGAAALADALVEDREPTAAEELDGLRLVAEDLLERQKAGTLVNLALEDRVAELERELEAARQPAEAAAGDTAAALLLDQGYAHIYNSLLNLFLSIAATPLEHIDAVIRVAEHRLNALRLDTINPGAGDEARALDRELELMRAGRRFRNDLKAVAERVAARNRLEGIR